MDFPAFYPIFLSALMWLTGLDCIQFGPIMNGLLFAALIYGCGWLMERFTVRSHIYKWVLLGCIVMSPCLQEVYSMIWSETLFILLWLLFIVMVRRYFIKHHIGVLVIIGVIAGLASVTRYAGISLILFGGLLIICDRKQPWGKKIVHCCLFGLIAVLPMALNIFRNKLVTGTLTGYREKAVTSFGANLYHFGTVFCDWLPFFNGRYQAAAWVGAGCILLCLGLLLYRVLKMKESLFSYEHIATAWFLLYACFILFIATISRFQQLDSRLLSPLYISWLWGCSSWIPRWLSKARALPRRVMAGATLVAGACFLWGEWQTWQFNWSGIKYAGIPGYTEDDWTYNQTMDFIRHSREMHQPDASIYSNAYEGIWFFTGIQSDIIPHKDIPGDIKEMLKEDSFYVVWFDDALNTDLIDINYISRYKKLSHEWKFNDGTVYFFTTL